MTSNGVQSDAGSGRPLRAGDVVEVRSKEEILQTLDANGQLEALPFMPEMIAFCGRRMRVSGRAHKTCDTVNDYKGRRMRNTVHLDNARCDGSAHGGCEAGCLIFWKEAWLKRVPASADASSPAAVPVNVIRSGRRPACTEAQVHDGTQRPADDGLVYVCQATQVPAATEPLGWWELSQYIEDYTSGNVGLGKMSRGFMFRGYKNLINLGIGLGPALRVLYDAFQRLWGGLPYPAHSGRIPAGERTPTVNANLQAGELVRVRSYDEILNTCDKSTKNRGMTFDAEMVPYIGGTYPVRQRVTRIINERTGRMQPLSNPCIVLEGVVCQARYSACRLFCPRRIFPYWREIWLERVGSDVSAVAVAQPPESVMTQPPAASEPPAPAPRDGHHADRAVD